MLSSTYLILFVISALYLFYLLYEFRQGISVYYFLLSICIILINFGYWQISIAETVEEALVATKVSYLGSSFVGYFMICCIAQLVKTNIPTAVHFVFFGTSSAITVLAMTVGHSDIYYKSVELIRENGYSYLVKDYGAAHTLFILNTVLSMCYCLVMVLMAFTKQKKVSYISCVCSLAVMASVTAVYFIKTGEYSLLPLAYDVGFVIIITLLTRIRLYNTVGLSGEVLEDSKEYGFATFDSRMHFLDCDDMARKWFPELNELKIDYSVSECNTDFLKQVREWVSGETYDGMCLFTCGEQIICAKINVLARRAKRKVFCISLQDDTKQQEHTRLIENYNRDLEKNVALKTKRLEEMLNDITVGMASIVENRDANTGGHIRRTSDIVRIFVQKLMKDEELPELDGKFADCIIRSAPLHDFGKIGISDAILNKPGKYTPEEYEEMKKHPIFGADIVERILQNSEDTEFKRVAKNIAHYHHEKWDGSGYPKGLRGTEIPIEARIMALADVFDALVSKRVYKEKFSFDEAVAIIKDSCGSHFDPFLCERFLNCKNELISVYSAEE